MQELQVGTEIIATNKHGFIEQPELWNEDVAQALAKDEGLDELSEDHWTAIRFVRGYYLEFGIAPMVRTMCRSTSLDLAQIYQLFPSGPRLGLCKIAGLPDSTGCL